MNRFRPVDAPQPRAAGRLYAVLLGTFALLAALWGHSAVAEESRASSSVEPQALIQGATEQLVVIVVQQREALREDPSRVQALVDGVVAPLLDVKRAAAHVLGPHWRTASAAQRKRFTDEFHRLLIRSFTASVSEFTDAIIEHLAPGTSVPSQLDSAITYLPMRRSDDGVEVMVRTRIRVPGRPPLGIEYRMHRRDGPWKIFDMTVEHMSLVATFRSSFDSVLRAEGIDRLIEQLAAKNQGRAATG